MRHTPSQNFYDVIVIGLGGMGSAAAYHLASRGARILGLDPFKKAHSLGSSHGQTRLIRKAYFEHPSYVPLLLRTYDLWESLERESQRPLLHKTGLTIFGTPDHPVLMGVRESARRYDLEVSEARGVALQEAHPALALRAGMCGLTEPEAGYLEVEACVEAHCTLAARKGADLRFTQGATAWKSLGDEVHVESGGQTFRAKKLVLAAGPWLNSCLADFQLPLQVHRVPQFWFRGLEKHKTKNGFTCFAFALPSGFFYGFPDLDSQGMKVALHQPLALVKDPTGVDRSISPADVAPVAQFIAEFLPGIVADPVAASVCMYTMTPDEHFILDVHPHHKNVILVSACSGHGFKFSAVIGEALADLGTSGVTDLPIDFLRLKGRFEGPV